MKRYAIIHTNPKRTIIAGVGFVTRFSNLISSTPVELSIENNNHFIIHNHIDYPDDGFYTVRINVPRYMLFDYMANRSIRYIHPLNENSTAYNDVNHIEAEESVTAGSITDKFIFVKLSEDETILHRHMVFKRGITKYTRKPFTCIERVQSTYIYTDKEQDFKVKTEKREITARRNNPYTSFSKYCSGGQKLDEYIENIRKYMWFNHYGEVDGNSFTYFIPSQVLRPYPAR